MFSFHIIDEIPATVEDIKKLPCGLYKLKDKACIIVKDELKSRAIYSSELYADAHPREYFNSLDMMFRSGLLLERQQSLDKLKGIEFRVSHITPKTSTVLEDTINYYKNTHKIRNDGIVQLGVELELEHNDKKPHVLSTAKIRETSKDLIDNIGSDPSVWQGVEIRFKHPTISKWDIKKIRKVLRECKKQHLGNFYGTAGMHVHVSGKGAIKAIRRASEEKDLIKRILYPISCRREEKERGSATRYGLNGDETRNQFRDFGTLEFRCFEATTDVKIFKRRLRFCKTLFEYLASDKPIRDFFKNLKKSEKINYLALLNDKNNPRYFGKEFLDEIYKDL